MEEEKSIQKFGDRKSEKRARSTKSKQKYIQKKKNEVYKFYDETFARTKQRSEPVTEKDIEHMNLAKNLYLESSNITSIFS